MPEPKPKDPDNNPNPPAPPAGGDNGGDNSPPPWVDDLKSEFTGAIDGLRSEFDELKESATQAPPAAGDEPKPGDDDWVPKSWAEVKEQARKEAEAALNDRDEQVKTASEEAKAR